MFRLAMPLAIFLFLSCQEIAHANFLKWDQPAQAGTAYLSDFNTQSSGYIRLADNFGSVGKVNQLIFWGAYNADTPPASFRFLVEFFLADAPNPIPGPGLPGTSVDFLDFNSDGSGTGPVTRIPDGTTTISTGISRPLYRFEVEFPEITFGPTMHWISIADFSPAPPVDWYWVNTSAPKLSGVAGQNLGLGGVWSTDTGLTHAPDDLAFQLRGIPEPNSIFMLSAVGLGLAIGGMRRRWSRKKKDAERTVPLQ